MPKKSREDTAQTRGKIVEVASRLFREKGVSATGVADIMKSAGLTHGGFYRHFDSKDTLAAEAISSAVSESLKLLQQSDDDETHEQALREYINRYLSEDHVNQPGVGCPLAALGGEAPHASAAAAQELGKGAEKAIAALAHVMGQDDERAGALLATLMGTVLLARMSAAPTRRAKILSTGSALAHKLAHRQI